MKFSIILPTFNRAHLLSRAIDSVLKQTESSWELIIVDDGSTDTTHDLGTQFTMHEGRIKYVFHSHRGLALSRAAGIAAASGEYVTFIDSDDEYAPDHLSQRRAYLESHPDVDLLHGGVKIIGDPYVADKFDPTKKIHISNCVVGGTFVIRGSLIERIGGWPNVPYGDDNAFYEKALAAGRIIAMIESPTYIYYRGEEDSLCAIAEKSGIAGVVKFQTGS